MNNKVENETPAEYLARTFHVLYETLAPEYGYETRDETAVPWDELPENNKQLMIAVCENILEDRLFRHYYKGQG